MLLAVEIVRLAMEIPSTTVYPAHMAITSTTTCVLLPALMDITIVIEQEVAHHVLLPAQVVNPSPTVQPVPLGSV